jgi:magnesium-transporting ATPase (P-type)
MLNLEVGGLIILGFNQLMVLYILSLCFIKRNRLCWSWISLCVYCSSDLCQFKYYVGQMNCWVYSAIFSKGKFNMVLLNLMVLCQYILSQVLKLEKQHIVSIRLSSKKRNRAILCPTLLCKSRTFVINPLHMKAIVQ